MCGRKRIVKATDTTEFTAYRTLERYILGLKNDLERSITGLIEAHRNEVLKALEKAEKDAKQRANYIHQVSQDRGAIPHSAKIAKDRTHPTAQD